MDWICEKKKGRNYMKRELVLSTVAVLGAVGSCGLANVNHEVGVSLLIFSCALLGLSFLKTI